MSLRQKILSEIKSLLSEDIQSITPATHQNYIRKMELAGRPYGLGQDPEQLISIMDAQLKKGNSTDDVYNLLKKNAPALGGFFSKNPTPPNYIYSRAAQVSATPGAKTPAPSKPIAPRYFVCKFAEETQAVKNFQTSKGLKPDGKIGKNTYAAILSDPSVLSAEVPFAKKGIKFNEVLGLSDPKMKNIYQRSVCEALAKTTATAKITGANPDVGTDPTGKYGPTLGKIKCPSFIKPTGPYSFEEIQKYVPNYLQGAQQNDDSLIFAIANTVTNAAKRSPSVGCEELIGFIQGAIKTKGRSVPGLSKIETPEQDAKSYEMDKLKAARAFASQGITADKVGDPEIVAVGKKYGVFKESKNWLDRTREETTSSLFERLVKDAAKKVL